MARETKVKAVEKLKGEIEKGKILGIIDLQKMPTKQLQEIKKQIRGKAKILITKKSTLLNALKQLNQPNISELEKIIPLQPALLLSDLEPFKLYGIIDKMKSLTYAKEGDVAQEDIVVSAGPTGLMPGPVISEFAKVGIAAGVEEGKIAIKKDKVVAKAGEKISKELANALRKLKIEPIKVGLKIVAIYEKEMIYKKDVLSLVGEAYVKQIIAANQSALNLSVSIGYPTKENIKLLLAKAYRATKAIENKIGGT